MTDPLPTINPKHTALLVMDYQPGILGRLPDAEQQLGRGEEAVTTARQHGCTVGYVRVAFTDDDYAAIPATSMMGASVAAAGKAFHSDAPATQIHERLAPQPGDVLVRKTRVGAFSTTNLAEQLGAREIDTLILAGISTSGVVLSTVRDAADRDYRIFVLADGSADPQLDVHEFLIEKIFPRQARVIRIADLAGLLGGAAR